MIRISSMMMSLVLGLSLLAVSASAQPPVISTSKMMYLLDPYYWVYDYVDGGTVIRGAANWDWQGVNQGFWQQQGHAVTVDFFVNGYPAASSLTFAVEGLTSPVTGSLVEDSERPGSYRGAFAVSEAAIGGASFKPGEVDQQGQDIVPKALLLTVSNANGPVASRQITITRWGCDRCHLAKDVAMRVYSWCEPTGGTFGPHYWGNILGRNDGRPGFDYTNLTDVTKTHTPTVGGYNRDGIWVENPLNRPPYHMKTNQKQVWGGCGNQQCAPCHQGSDDTPRMPSFCAGPDPDDSRGKSLTVRCSFCHGMAGGYIPKPPNPPLWEQHLIDWDCW